MNVADAAVTGTECDAQYAWTDRFDTGISYTYNDSRDLYTDLLLPMRPKHTARFWGQEKLAAIPVILWAETVIRSATWNDTAHALPIGGSVQVNAAIRYALSHQAEVYLRGENLTNNRTPQLFSTDMPGIAFSAGFEWIFRSTPISLSRSNRILLLAAARRLKMRP